MQIYSYLICLVLLFAINLISARTLNFNHDEYQIESDDRSNDQQRREIILRKLSSPFTVKRLFTNHLTNDHFMPMIRHAKAIIKGDPREFMG